MVQNFQLDVIKVTITDKPGLQKEDTDEESLRKAFNALKQYAQQEHRIRKLKDEINERNSRRRLKHYFDTWHKRTVTMKKFAEYTRIETQVSKERKIELLVSAIAERQREKSITSVESNDIPKRTKAQTPTQTPAKKQQSLRKTKPIATTCTQSRLEAQKMIIQEQKAKLAEQNKKIEEMKLKEIDKETKETAKQTVEVVKKAFNKCDHQTRRSLIHLMREQGYRDKTITEISQMPSPPQFLARMEARAEARKQRIKEINELRQRQREEQKRREEISRKEAEEQLRQQQIQAIKESQRLRREQEIRRIKEIEKKQKLEYLADLCYNRYLFRRYILEPLNSIVEEKYKSLEKADHHYRETLLYKVFTAWKNEWHEQQMNKIKLAEKLYRHNLMWYAFDDWKCFALDMRQKYQTAVDYFDMKLQGKCLKAWHLMYEQVRAIMHEKEVKAIKHCEKRIKEIYFNLWRKYRLISDDIKRREQRRVEWRDLIKKFIPDDTPKLRKASLNS